MIALICGATVIGGMAIHGGTERTESAGKDNVDLRAYEDSRWLAYAPPLPVPEVRADEVPSGAEVIDAPTPATEPPDNYDAHGDYPRAVLAAMVGAAFPDDLRMSNHVVWAESIGDWNKNWQCTVYGGCWSVTSDCGLMAIHWAAHADKFYRRGWTEADCWIPEHNLVVAREIYDTQGPQAWTTY